MAATIRVRAGRCWDSSISTPSRRLSVITIANTPVSSRTRPELETAARSVAGFFLFARSFGLVGLAIFVGFRIAVVGTDFVIVEIAHQLSGAPFFHHPFQAPPRRLSPLGSPTPLRIDVTHDLIDVDIIATGRGVFGVLFLELFGFRFLAHSRAL